MVFDIKNLHNDVGLKLDELVILGKTDVECLIKERQELFEGIEVEPINNSHMLYGYNKLGNPIKLGFEGKMINKIIVSTKASKGIRYKGCISYDGHNYNGFQIQRDQPTIQGELTRVISTVNGEITLVQGASRTDAGVHALNYVFHFNTDKPLTKERWLEYLNYQLPKDIYVLSLEQVHPLFHSRYDVYKKRYMYKINTKERNPLRINYEWFTQNINTDILEDNLKQLMGIHDFQSFCKGTHDSTIRTIYKAELIKNDNELTLVFEGNGFLRYMIRIVVYALIKIAKGELDQTITEIIKVKSRKYTKDLAPASGLYLEEITY